MDVYLSDNRHLQYYLTRISAKQNNGQFRTLFVSTFLSDIWRRKRVNKTLCMKHEANKDADVVGRSGSMKEIDSVLTDSGNVMFFWASVMTENVYRCLDI